MSDKAKIAARIRALRAKTVANGCTEEEAAAAAEMVAAMLEKYNLTVEECDLRENGFARQETVCDDLVGERLWKIADGIAHMMDVRYWASAPGMPPSVTFFGFDHEVEIATYLLDICRNAMNGRMWAMEREWRLLRDSARRRRIVPFLDGMADRLRQRIREMRPPQPAGTGLVVLRNQLIDTELEREVGKLNSGRARSSPNFEPDYATGLRAADDVALNQGVGGPSRSAGMIGGAR